MSKPSIIITGATGFIGGALVDHFLMKGFLIKAFVRSIPSVKLKSVEYILYDLETPPDEHHFESVDYAVHCAYLKYEKNNNADAINIQAVKTLINCCRKKNTQFLFISSFSAHAAATSHYGKTKLACEKLIDLRKDLVLKPGFVMGKQGMGTTLIATLNKANFFPLTGGGGQPIQTIYIDDLCLSIELLLKKNAVGLFHLAEPEAISMKIFYKEIGVQLNKKIIFIPFPLSLLLAFCKVAEAFGIRLPVSSESVLGLKHLISFDTKKELETIGIVVKNYRESIALVVGNADKKI
jgi:nucleoside-diphosphate-sugar epimerase